MVLAAQAVEDALANSETGAWAPVELPFTQMPARFGYQLLPQA